MHVLGIKARVFTYPAMALLFVIASWSYHEEFRGVRDFRELVNQEAERGYTEWETKKLYYTLDYDSILYESLFKDGIDANFIVANYSTMPNVMGISVLAALARRAGIDIFTLNLMLLLVTGWILVRIAAILHLSPALPLACIYLNPVSVFYCQTATKEVPLMLGCTLLAYLSLRFRKALPFFALPVLAGITFMRVQTGVLLGVLVVLGTLRYRVALRFIWTGLFIFFALLPLTSFTEFWTGADSYQEMSGRVGIGKFIDFGLKTIPFAGYALIPLRAIQNALDPFPFAPLLNDGKSVWSLYAIFGQLSFYFYSYIFVGLIPLLWRYLRGRIEPSRKKSVLILFVIFGWFSVAIVPYVQGRYLFPFLPLAAFALGLSSELVSKIMTRYVRLAWAALACLQAWIALEALL